MSQAFSENMAPKWVLQRAMDFLNGAKNAQEIREAVKDDPHQTTGEGKGKDFAIGEKVAQNILDARGALSRQRFTQITELNGISGLGPDKANDLVQSFNLSADEAFKRGMYNGVVFEANFDLEYHYVHFTSDSDLKAVMDCEKSFVHTVGHLVDETVALRTNSRVTGEVAGRYLENCWLERTNSAHQASFYFAYWFYRFDSDNWFSFDRVRQETEAYLEHNSTTQDRLELFFFKGFDQQGLLADAITVPDLPVVVNYAERRITIWGAGLRD
jgi:hypothetical protein